MIESVVAIHADDSGKLGRSVELLHALNLANASLQHSAYTEQDVLRAFSAQIVRLRLMGLIILLDKDGHYLAVRTKPHPSTSRKPSGQPGEVQVEDLDLPASKVEELKQFLEYNHPTFLDNTNPLLQKMVSTETAWLEWIQALGDHPSIYTPLKSDPFNQGMLIVSGADLTKTDVPAIQAFANHIAIALSNARLFASMRQQTEELSTIYDVSLNITASQDLPGLLETIVEQATKLLRGTSGGFYLCNAEIQEVRCVVSYRTQRDFRGTVLKYGEGVAGWVAQTGQPIVIDDYRTWSGRAAVYEEEQPFRSIISAPVIWQAKVTGVLHVLDDREQRIFTPGELRTLTLLSNQAAIAIENARLLEGERRRRQEAETLSRASSALVSTLDLQGVLDNILIRLSEVIPYDSATVFLLEGQRLHGKAARGLPSPETVIGQYFPADDRLFEQIRQTGQPLILEDAHTHPDFQRWGKTDHVRGWMGIPLITKEVVIGYMTCDNRQRGAYQPADAVLAQAFANQAATAIENARLFEAERAQLLVSRTLQEVGALLTTQLSLGEVLENILDLLGRVVQYDTVSIQLLTPTGNLSLSAGRGFENIDKTRKIIEGLSDHMLKSKLAARRVLVIPDTYNDERWIIVPGTEYVRSWIGAPLMVKGRLIGCLNVDSCTVNAYDESTGDTVMAFAHQAAIAIENARLFEQTMTERRHLRLLYDINQEMTSSLDPDEILQRVITLTSQALGGLVGQAHLYSPGDEYIRLRALYGRNFDSIPATEPAYTLPLGTGLIGWVAQNRQSAFVHDVTQDARWQHYSGIDDDVQSALSAPILVGEKLLGVLTVLHHEASAFSQEHLQLLEAICREVGLALSNAQRYQQIQRLSTILQAQQRQLENLLEHMPLGVLLLDSDLQIRVMNPLGHKILTALNEEEINLNQTLARVGPITLHELFDRKATALPVEITSKDHPKRIYAVQLRAAQASRETTQRQWVLTIHDITQEREYLTRIQIQERLATVGQLAAGIAHDFNNIMATILVYADLMSMDTSIPLTIQEKLEIIRRQIQRASSLIRQILDFSRKSVMEQSPLDLLPLVKELDKILARTLPETIELELDYEPDSFWVHGDPTRLQQVFMNLALNARDAMPEGGRLTISLEHVQIPFTITPPIPDMPPGNWVQITVADTGMGIPPEVQAHIFEPFFTTKPVDQGTGLGLAQVYGIVRQHDGFIDFRSRTGAGTSFMIYLPALSIEAQIERPPDTGPLLDGNGMQVMVVEDDHNTSTALQALLTAYGFRVQPASNGVQALQLLQETALHDGGQVHLVVSDIVMPQMGGLELYQILQERFPEIKTLLITGHPLQEDSHAWLEQGSVQWLQKPFSAQEFKQAINRLLDAP